MRMWWHMFFCFALLCFASCPFASSPPFPSTRAFLHSLLLLSPKPGMHNFAFCFTLLKKFWNFDNNAIRGCFFVVIFFWVFSGRVFLWESFWLPVVRFQMRSLQGRLCLLSRRPKLFSKVKVPQLIVLIKFRFSVNLFWWVNLIVLKIFWVPCQKNLCLQFYMMSCVFLVS